MNNLAKLVPAKADLSFLDGVEDIYIHIFERILSELVQEPYKITSNDIKSESLSTSKIDKSVVLTLNLKDGYYLKIEMKPCTWTGKGVHSKTVFTGFNITILCSVKQEVIDIYELEDMIALDKHGEPYMQGEWKFESLFDLPAMSLIEYTIGNFIQFNRDASKQ